MAGQALAGACLDPRAVRVLGRGRRSDRGRRLRRQALDPAAARRGRRRRSRSSRTTSTPTRSPPTTASCSRTAPATRSRSREEIATVHELARPRAGARDLPRPPAARARARPARPPSCRSATAAPTTPWSSARTGRVLVTSQNHGFAVEPDGATARDARVALRRHRRGPRLPGAARALGAVPPGGGAGAARRAAAASSRWVEEVRLAAA